MIDRICTSGGVIFGLVFLVLTLVVAAGVYLHERKVVRDGHCREQWVRIDSNSQGQWILQCKVCGKYTTTSWHKDARYIKGR